MSLNDFFTSIAKSIQENHISYTPDDFYYLLKYLNIDKNDTLASDIENFYEDFLKSLSNSLVKYETKKTKEGVNQTNYLALYTTETCPHQECIKLYFPVKYEYLISALKTTFIYLVHNNIKCVIKFHLKATNEAIVIEFYHQEDVLPFINYCNNNFILKELLEPLNPFMVNYQGFGIIKNYQGSYLNTIAKLLSTYFSLIIKNQDYTKVSVLDFLSYLIDFKDTVLNDNNLNIIIKNIKTILNNNGNLTLEDF